MHKCLYLCGLIVILGMVLGALSECPQGWFHYDKSCFYFSHEKLNWFTAESSCRGHNARLAEPETKDVSDFLIATATAIQGRTGHTPYYLGARDDIIEGTWMWASSDEVIDYSSWGPGEPNGREGSNCLTMYHTLTWQWSDDPCKTEFYYVCEKMYVKFRAD